MFCFGILVSKLGKFYKLLQYPLVLEGVGSVVLQEDQRWISPDAELIAKILGFGRCAINFRDVEFASVFLMELLPEWRQPFAMTAPWCEELEEPGFACMNFPCTFVDDLGVEVLNRKILRLLVDIYALCFIGCDHDAYGRH